MTNRQLTASERESLFAPLIAEVRKRLDDLSAGDSNLKWALRRKLYKELTYDERNKPMHRKLLKLTKVASQKGLCAVCSTELPKRNAVLDRFQAMLGYTEENTRVICSGCNTRIQEERGYA